MNARSKGNPFAQPKKFWKVSFVLSGNMRDVVEHSFEGMSLAVSGFEADEAKNLWNYELLCGEMPDMTEIHRRLLVLSALDERETPRAEMSEVESQDWKTQVARSFPPLSIGRFYVHGSHVKEREMNGRIAIQVDAGAAFGSGEHGTTRGCLEAFELLERQRRMRNILDMGCGSGILAIAAAKLWGMPVLAADIDPVAVEVAKRNAAVNRVQQYMTAVVSDGYASEKVKRGGPYDLIVANILARPLVKFAPQLALHLEPGGAAVLSGLLASQETQVRTAHQMQGLTFVRRIVHGDWATLILRK
jgi:ribosomal protein L11 methyltransferase